MSRWKSSSPREKQALRKTEVALFPYRWPFTIIYVRLSAERRFLNSTVGTIFCFLREGNGLKTALPQKPLKSL